VSERPRFKQFSPIFPVTDLKRALDHYASLGFETNAYAGGDFYGFAERDGVGLHLALEHGGHDHGGDDHAHDHEPSRGQVRRHGTDGDRDEEHEGGVAYLYVDSADALYQEWTRPGIAGTTWPVGDTEYKLREGSHRDPDGNVIRFGSPMPPTGEAAVVKTHIESHYGVEVADVAALDIGVYRLELADGTSWVARFFPARRSLEAAEGDAEVLRFLAGHDFAAEKPAAIGAVSQADGRPVLVTEFVTPVPPRRRREAIVAVGGLRYLGSELGRLHSLPPAPASVGRPGGAWHHLADGSPHLETQAVKAMLAGSEARVAAGEAAMYEYLATAVERVDSGEGLPQALIHPDYVLGNVVASASGGLVLVDWTGAGIGPRLWNLAWFLYAEGAKSLARVDRVLEGYRQHVELGEDELVRMESVMRARPLTLQIWSWAAGNRTLAATAGAVAESAELASDVADRVRRSLAI
jgi:Ser/Thr protein kinase RdoA (MazF antagonist)